MSRNPQRLFSADDMTHTSPYCASPGDPPWWPASYPRGTFRNRLWRGNAPHVETSPAIRAEIRTPAATAPPVCCWHTQPVSEFRASWSQSWHGRACIFEPREWWRRSRYQPKCGNRGTAIQRKYAACANRRWAGRRQAPGSRPARSNKSILSSSRHPPKN